MSCVILRNIPPHVKVKPPPPFRPQRVGNSLFLPFPMTFSHHLHVKHQGNAYSGHSNCTHRVVCNPGLCRASKKPSAVLFTRDQNPVSPTAEPPGERGPQNRKTPSPNPRPTPYAHPSPNPSPDPTHYHYHTEQPNTLTLHDIGPISFVRALHPLNNRNSTRRTRRLPSAHPIIHPTPSPHDQRRHRDRKSDQPPAQTIQGGVSAP